MLYRVLNKVLYSTQVRLYSSDVQLLCKSVLQIYQFHSYNCCSDFRKTNIPSISPLNFQINTIPKSGHFFYFAYGLNMNQKR